MAAKKKGTMEGTILVMHAITQLQTQSHTGNHLTRLRLISKHALSDNSIVPCLEEFHQKPLQLSRLSTPLLQTALGESLA